MGFWRYCEKVEGFVGNALVIKYIGRVRQFWEENRTVGEAAEHLKSAAHNDRIENP